VSAPPRTLCTLAAERSRRRAGARGAAPPPPPRSHPKNGNLIEKKYSLSELLLQLVVVTESGAHLRHSHCELYPTGLLKRRRRSMRRTGADCCTGTRLSAAKLTWEPIWIELLNLFVLARARVRASERPGVLLWCRPETPLVAATRTIDNRVAPLGLHVEMDAIQRGQCRSRSPCPCTPSAHQLLRCCKSKS
jgi:hypothetical protein